MSSETTTVLPRNIPRFRLHVADANKRKRRALIKAVGKRQFKKMYRGAEA